MTVFIPQQLYSRWNIVKAALIGMEHFWPPLHLGVVVIEMPEYTSEILGGFSMPGKLVAKINFPEDAFSEIDDKCVKLILCHIYRFAIFLYVFIGIEGEHGMVQIVATV